MKRSWLIAITLVLAACTSTKVPVSEGGQTLRIYLARHGQTDWNLAHRLQGQSDTELNDTGRKQARDLASRLEGVRFERVYSSALKRSRATAQTAANGAPVESLPSLNEQALGKFEGLYLDGRDAAAEADYNLRSKRQDDSLDGGESSEQFFTRVCTAVSAIRREHESGSILIVGHGGTNAMILRCFLELTAEQADAIRQSNDELYLIELSSKRSPRLWKLIPKDKLSEL
ncbi:MAG TPA: histidine phosphatase family protein [Thermoanaerobaculia bacterium]|nr:histidine phosphatase family protein [Thermoanaerobaculia bacterium]